MRLKLGRDRDPHPEGTIDQLQIRHLGNPHDFGTPAWVGSRQSPAGVVDSTFWTPAGSFKWQICWGLRYERFLMVISRVLTGRGADIIVIDDPLKPEEALS